MKKKFSIVVALAPYREAEVEKSLQKMDYNKKDYEVIIKKGVNPSENRNQGAKKAKGKIIGFIDDDAVVDRKILIKAEEFFDKNKDIDVAGGPQLTPLDERGFAKISGYALSSKFGAWEASNRYDGKKTLLNADESMLTSANLFCRREVFKKIRFDAKLWPGEDPKFIEEAIKAGFKVAYSPEIIVYHRRRPSTKSLIKQIYNYGKTRPKKESFGNTLKRPFFLVPSLFLTYLYILIFFVFPISFTGAVIGSRPVSLDKLLFFSSILIIYIILSLMFSAFHAIKNRSPTTFFVLPFIFFIIHISYGAGFIVSSIKKLIKNKDK